MRTLSRSSGTDRTIRAVLSVAGGVRAGLVPLADDVETGVRQYRVELVGHSVGRGRRRDRRGPHGGRLRAHRHRLAIQTSRPGGRAVIAAGRQRRTPYSPGRPSDDEVRDDTTRMERNVCLRGSRARLRAPRAHRHCQRGLRRPRRGRRSAGRARVPGVTRRARSRSLRDRLRANPARCCRARNRPMCPHRCRRP